MIKSLVISLVLITSISTYSVAQKTYSDSIKKAVRIDAQRFRLNASDFIKFRAGGISKSSDFFKPNSNIIVPHFLKDSTYVNAYRNATYLKTEKRRTASHHVLIWGTAIVVAPIIVFSGF